MDAREYLLASEVRLDELYHANSKYEPMLLSFLSRVQLAARDRRIHATQEAAAGRDKIYTAFAPVDLPRALRPLTSSLDDVLIARCSQRTFAPAPLTTNEIATLLARGYGTSGTRGSVAARVVPSGGGLYPLDLYVLQGPGQSFEEGVYHYHVGRHALQRVATRCTRDDVAAASSYPEVVTQAPVLLAVAASMQHTRAKYGERAYRLALLEAGHVSQNLYLVATALRLGIVALDGFHDDLLHELLGLDGVTEIALLLFAIGRVP